MSLAQYSQDSIVRTVFSGRHCYDSILWTALLGHYSQDNIVRPPRSKSNTKRAFLFKRKSPQHDQRPLGRGEPLWQTLFFLNALPVLVMEGFEKVLKTCTRMQTFEIKEGPKMGRFLGSILDKFEGSSSNCTFSET